MIKNRGITFKLIFFILSSCTLIFAVVFGYNYLVSRQIIIQNIEENAKNLTLLTVNKIETILRPIEKIPQSLAFLAEQTLCEKEDILSVLRSLVANNPEIYGSTIAFEPHAFAKDSLYFAPYFYKNKNKLEFTYLGGEAYQYFYWDWYQIPKELGIPVWSEPYYDEGGGNIIMSTYSVPFYKEIEGKRRFMGVVTADVSLSWLQDIVSSIRIGDTGYGFLISNNGRIVTHPRKNLIMHETIFSVAEARDDSQLRQIGKDMISGKSGFIPSQSLVTGKSCWMAYKPIPSTAWSLGVLFPRNELMADITRLNWVAFALGLLGFLVLLVVIVLISGTITRPLRSLFLATKDIAKGNLNFNLPIIKSGDEVGRLANSFVYMKDALKEYIKDLKEATAVKERMESELKIAHDIQMSIVPKIFPPFPDQREFDIYALLEPAKEVGGDLYDFFFLDKKRLCFVIGDVSGKGVPAALFMAVVKTLIKTVAHETGSPDKIMERVNKETSSGNDACMFVTVFCGILNIETGEVSYTNAGHNPPLIIHGKDRLDFLGLAKNTAIGINEDTAFKKEEVVLRPGDAIYMYTDGVTEAFNKNRELFSEERLKREVSLCMKDSARELAKKTLNVIRDFSKDVPQSDDITIMVLKYFSQDKEASDALGRKTVIIKNDIHELKTLRSLVSDFVRDNHLSKTIINDVNLVLEEIVSNIIFYGYKDAQGHSITINFDLEEDELILRITDDARAFNPLQAPEPDINKPIEERKIGGLGIYLTRKFTDNIEYKRVNKENVLTLKKIIKKTKE